MKDTEDGRVRCRRHQTGSRVEARALEVQHSRGGVMDYDGHHS